MMQYIGNYDDPRRKAAIFEDTVERCRNDEKLITSIDDTIKRTRIYSENYRFTKFVSKYSETKISVTKERSFKAAERLKNLYPDSRIAVLNFASATNPGGGVRSGSSAQEESLCRCSTLYPCLNTPKLMRSFYQMHRNLHDLRYTDTCVYLPDITVFKNDTAFPEPIEESAWYKVDVITCAAPNLRKAPYNSAHKGKSITLTLTDAELHTIHKIRGSRIMNAAMEHGADVLVFGAFGCGAFANNPYVVARAYQELMVTYGGYFREVCFAVYCTPRDDRNYVIFNRMLGARGQGS